MSNTINPIYGILFADFLYTESLLGKIDSVYTGKSNLLFFKNGIHAMSFHKQLGRHEKIQFIDRG